MIEIEICLFNSLSRYAREATQRLRLPAGTRPAEVVRRLGVPQAEIFVAWKNGHNILRSLGGDFEEGALADGDRLALSGPVPFSRAYGAPVC